MIHPYLLVAGVALLAIASFAFAHGEQQHSGTSMVRSPPAEQKGWGIGGDAKDVARTIEIRMLDSMDFEPDRLTVRVGETVRFVMHNHGKLMHELVIGTRQVLDEHSALMRKFPDMQHDEPYMAHVPPGRTGEIVWKFNRAGAFDFACLIAGHYEAGMVGRITVLHK